MVLLLDDDADVLEDAPLLAGLDAVLAGAAVEVLAIPVAVVEAVDAAIGAVEADADDLLPPERLFELPEY